MRPDGPAPKELELVAPTWIPPRLAVDESTAGSSGEPSDNFGSPLNKGSAKSVPGDGLVEATVSLGAPPSPNMEPGDEPSGRLNKLDEPPRFMSNGAFEAVPYPNAPSPASSIEPGMDAEVAELPLT